MLIPEAQEQKIQDQPSALSLNQQKTTKKNQPIVDEDGSKPCLKVAERTPNED